MTDDAHHVFLRPGDGLAQVEDALARLAAAGVTREASGLRRVLYVTRADQTVVMLDGPGAPLAAALRALPGWREPGAGAG